MRISLLVLLNEIQKGLLHVWRYKANLLAQLAMFSFLFVGIGFLMGRGHIDVSVLPSMLVGFVMWYYAFMAILNMSSSLAIEAQTGTLEQTYMSAAPQELIFVGRALATFVTTTVMGLLMVGALVAIFRLHLGLSLAVVPVFLLTLIGVFGFGFMVGGATLAFKRVDAFANLVQNMLLFLNGTLLAVDLFPWWMAALANTLPTTIGITVLRAVTIDGVTLGALARNGALAGLALHSGVYLVGGWLIFRWCERYARRRGTLGHY
jgi:ABC-2 type transport system permease protein